MKFLLSLIGVAALASGLTTMVNCQEKADRDLDLFITYTIHTGRYTGDDQTWISEALRLLDLNHYDTTSHEVSVSLGVGKTAFTSSCFESRVEDRTIAETIKHVSSTSAWSGYTSTLNVISVHLVPWLAMRRWVDPASTRRIYLVFTHQTIDPLVMTSQHLHIWPFASFEDNCALPDQYPSPDQLYLALRRANAGLVVTYVPDAMGALDLQTWEDFLTPIGYDDILLHQPPYTTDAGLRVYRALRHMACPAYLQSLLTTTTTEAPTTTTTKPPQYDADQIRRCILELPSCTPGGDYTEMYETLIDQCLNDYF